MKETHSIKKNDTTKTRKSTTICHWLPCSIDYDGFAPIQMHFRPEIISPLKNNTSNDNHEEDEHKRSTSDDGTKSSSSRSIQAVSFRGRGLLANNDDNNSTLPHEIIGSVMMPTTKLTSNNGLNSHDNNGVGGASHCGTVVVKETFDKVLQWEHESYEQNLINSGTGAEVCFDVKKQGSIGKSLAMFEILRSVHDPIPVCVD